MGTGGPRDMVESIRAARRELAAGHVVCIFAEGAISRTGNMLPFKRGMEKIVEGTDVPIIPVHLDRLWGSIFSFDQRQILLEVAQANSLSRDRLLRRAHAFQLHRASRAPGHPGTLRRSHGPPQDAPAICSTAASSTPPAATGATSPWPIPPAASSPTAKC